MVPTALGCFDPGSIFTSWSVSVSMEAVRKEGLGMLVLTVGVGSGEIRR